MSLKATCVATLFLYSAIGISAQTPTLVHLQELPTEFRGEFLVTAQGTEGNIERPSSPKPFGKIEARRVVLASGDTLRVSKIDKLPVPGRAGTQSLTVVVFENREFFWSISPRQKIDKIVSFDGSSEVVSPTGELMITQVATGQTSTVLFMVLPKRAPEPSAPANESPPGR